MDALFFLPDNAKEQKMNLTNDDKPEITYPCEWGYKVIGIDPVAIKEAVGGILGNRRYSIALSKTSSKGKYTSLDVSLIVNSEVERHDFFKSFAQDPAIKMVL